MFLQDYIKHQIPPLKETDTIATAKEWLRAFKTGSLPVLSGKKYLGLIDEQGLQNIRDTQALLSTLVFTNQNYFVFYNQYINDALQLMSNYKIEILPVLNSKGEYTGMLTALDIIEAIAHSKSVKTPGGVIELQVPVKDFSISHLANIVESNEGTILNITVEQMPDMSQYGITIKINKVDLTRILAGFYRHDIHVVAYYNHTDGSGDIQNRYDSFMSYLNV